MAIEKNSRMTCDSTLMSWSFNITNSNKENQITVTSSFWLVDAFWSVTGNPKAWWKVHRLYQPQNVYIWVKSIKSYIWARQHLKHLHDTLHMTCKSSLIMLCVCEFVSNLMVAVQCICSCWAMRPVISKNELYHNVAPLCHVLFYLFYVSANSLYFFSVRVFCR